MGADLLRRAHPPWSNDNWKDSVDKSLGYGMNKVRMHVYAQNFYRPEVEFQNIPMRSLTWATRRIPTATIEHPILAEARRNG